MKKRITIVDYGAGNIRSILFALERLGYGGILSDNPAEITTSNKVIFPGVGQAGTAMRKLKESGLDKVIPNLKQPVLGICLGMQLMCNRSEEGETEGLGIFDVDVVKFSTKLKVPHIGWNRIGNLKTSLFQDVKEEEYVYLVHSFYASICSQTVGSCQYGLNYSSALNNNNFYGVQFHPEKSGTTGEKILNNFLELPE